MQLTRSRSHSGCNEKTPIILCPDCKTKIPRLYLHFNSNGQMNVGLKCYCTKENKTFSLGQFLDKMIDQQDSKQCSIHTKLGERYCNNCSSWLCQECMHYHQTFYDKQHLIMERELQIICSEHKKRFLFYCKSCKVNICKRCQDHNNHKLIPIPKNQHIEFLINKMDKVMYTNHHFAYELLEKIDTEINKLTQIRNDLRMSIDLNESVNEELKELHRRICHTTDICGSYLSYELMILQKNIIVNTKEFQEVPGLSIEEEAQKLQGHLRMNHVLSQRATSECTAVLIGHSQSVKSLVELNDKRLASCSYDNSIRLWNTTANKSIDILKEHNDFVSCLTLLTDDRLVSCSYDKTIIIWNTVTAKCIERLQANNEIILCLVELNDGRFASCSYNNEIMLRNEKLNESVGVLKGHSECVWCIAKLADGRLASGSEDKTIKLWNTSLFKCLATLANHGNSVLCLVELSDGRLASSSSDKTIKLWNCTTTECLGTLTGHVESIGCIVELSDGRLASGSFDKTIRLWNLNTGECETTLNGHSQSVLCLAELIEGRLASGSEDNTIRLWDV